MERIAGNCHMIAEPVVLPAGVCSARTFALIVARPDRGTGRARLRRFFDIVDARTLQRVRAHALSHTLR